MDLGHEGGWHGEHEALHQHAWAWALTQAQIHFHHGQAQDTHSPHSPLRRLGITFKQSFLSLAWREAKWPLSGKGREAHTVGEDGGDDYGWQRRWPWEPATPKGKWAGVLSTRRMQRKCESGGRGDWRWGQGFLGDEAHGSSSWLT